jgi:hypothetical protein
MEGRMMLSTTAPDFAGALPTPLIASGIELDETMLLPIPERHAATSWEGGFIVGDTLSLVRGDWFSDVQSQPYVPISIEELLGNAPLFDSDATAAQYISLDLFASGGLIPRTFSADVGDLYVASPISPSSIEASADAEEGGLISLQPMPGPSRPPIEAKDALNSFAQSAVTPIPDVQPDRPAPLSSSQSATRELSGEWARAAVFEIAGGEPEAYYVQSAPSQLKPVAAPVKDSSARSADSIPSGDDHADAARYVAPTATTRLPIRTVSFRYGDMASHEQTAEMLFAVALNEVLQHAGPVAVPSAALRDEAVTAAFDELGGDELSLPSLSTTGIRLDGWFNNAPVLLLFALERVTARRSRRSPTSGRSAETARPRLS